MAQRFTRRTILKAAVGGLSSLSCLNRMCSCEASDLKIGRRVRWAHGWILWRNYKGQTLSLKDAALNLRAAGADGIEFTPGQNELEKQGLTLPSLKELLQQYELAISGQYFSAAFYDTSKKDEILQATQQRIAFLNEFGGSTLVIGPPRDPRSSQSRLELIRQQAAVLNELGRRALDQGVKIGIHPHLNTLIEVPSEIEAAMESTDPRYVWLAPDTGHIHLAGGDVVAIVKKYRSRLVYFHFKDAVRPFERPHFASNLRELGRGEVDFPGVMRVLKEIRYQGWINVEQDFTALTPKESCEISMGYVNQKLKLIYS